jgi:RNA polymerase sigma-70 factor (ECF subfamily)
MQRTQDPDFAAVWQADRPYLVDVAFRMLGDLGAAEDVVQEAFSRLLRTPLDEIDDARGWLTVVTSRLCLDQIKSARSRHERPDDGTSFERHDTGPRGLDPADRITLDESVRLALVVVLERLTPAERVAFVLHDVFQMPFPVIAETVGRSAASCRQLAHRARVKVEAAEGAETFRGGAEHQAVLERFIAACATGDLDALLRVLDPDVTGTIDLIGDLVVVGADRVAANMHRFWSTPETTLVSQPVGGQPALLGFAGHELTGILLLTLTGDRVSEIHVLAAPTVLELARSQLSAAAGARR